MAEFKRGRTSCQDAQSSGRPIEVAMLEMFKKIHKIVLDDRLLKVRGLAEMKGIAKSTIYRILAENFETRKLSARWQPIPTIRYPNPIRSQNSKHKPNIFSENMKKPDRWTDFFHF